MIDQDAERPAQISDQEFFRLFSLAERRVSLYIVALVPNWADAADLIQETHLRLWDQRGRFVPGTNFGGWACTIAKFVVARYRTTKSRERLQFTDQFVEVVSEEDEEDDIDERQSALSHCIERLSARDANMLRAFYDDHAQRNDVAVRFGRSVSALTKAIWRLRKALHECVQHKLQGS